jgi:hypothetical protein
MMAMFNTVKGYYSSFVKLYKFFFFFFGLVSYRFLVGLELTTSVSSLLLQGEEVIFEVELIGQIIHNI